MIHITQHDTLVLQVLDLDCELRLISQSVAAKSQGQDKAETILLSQSELAKLSSASAKALQPQRGSKRLPPPAPRRPHSPQATHRANTEHEQRNISWCTARTARTMEYACACASRITCVTSWAWRPMRAGFFCTAETKEILYPACELRFRCKTKSLGSRLCPVLELSAVIFACSKDGPVRPDAVVLPPVTILARFNWSPARVSRYYSKVEKPSVDIGLASLSWGVQISSSAIFGHIVWIRKVL